jgi:uncharacterized protein YwgA
LGYFFSPFWVKESVLVKNVVKQAKKYQEKLEELGKKQDIEDDELEALKVQLPTWWDYDFACLTTFLTNTLSLTLSRSIIGSCFNLAFNMSIKRSNPLISTMNKNVVKQAKKYQEKLEGLGKKQDIEDDELEALKVQLPK